MQTEDRALKDQLFSKVLTHNRMPSGRHKPPKNEALTERLARYLRWIVREGVRGQQRERHRVGSEVGISGAGMCIEACIDSYLATRRAMCQETETERMRFHRQNPRSFLDGSGA